MIDKTSKTESDRIARYRKMSDFMAVLSGAQDEVNALRVSSAMWAELDYRNSDASGQTDQ